MPYEAADGFYRSAVQRADRRIRRDEFVMASDEMSSAKFTAFLSTVFRNLAAYSINGSIHFICMDWRHMPEILAAA